MAWRLMEAVGWLARQWILLTRSVFPPGPHRSPVT
jgi:hypothetical protein